MAAKKESVRKSTFLQWPFASDFNYEEKDGIISSLTCKFCTQVGGKKLSAEAKVRGLRGKTLSQIEKLGETTYYVHRPTVQRHVGGDDSLHQWCKKQVRVLNKYLVCFLSLR